MNQNGIERERVRWGGGIWNEAGSGKQNSIEGKWV